MRSCIDFVKQNSIAIIGKASSGVCALSFGFSAGGFIIGFCKYLGFSTGSPIWAQGLVYGGAAIVGANAAFRIWSVAQVGAPKGLKLIFSQNAEQTAVIEASKKIKFLKVLGVGLSFFAGATYGGLTYLGISHLFDFKSLWVEISIGIVTIGSNFIASGGLFSYAWIQGLTDQTLFNFQRTNSSKIYLLAEILSSIIAIFGLGCTMTLGSLGLAKSIERLPELSTILGSIIAFIGFFGEAPFAIKQGRLLISQISKAKEKSLEANEEAISKKRKRVCLSSVKVTSVLVYTTNSFAGTYTDIGNFSIPIRVLLATGSAYLSMVTSLEETEINEGERKHLLANNKFSLLGGGQTILAANTTIQPLSIDGSLSASEESATEVNSSESKILLN